MNLEIGKLLILMVEPAPRRALGSPGSLGPLCFQKTEFFHIVPFGLWEDGNEGGGGYFLVHSEPDPNASQPSASADVSHCFPGCFFSWPWDRILASFCIITVIHVVVKEAVCFLRNKNMVGLQCLCPPGRRGQS